jgi:hypothetical protein
MSGDNINTEREELNLKWTEFWATLCLFCTQFIDSVRIEGSRQLNPLLKRVNLFYDNIWSNIFQYRFNIYKICLVYLFMVFIMFGIHCEQEQYIQTYTIETVIPNMFSRSASLNTYLHDSDTSPIHELYNCLDTYEKYDNLRNSQIKLSILENLKFKGNYLNLFSVFYHYLCSIFVVGDYHRITDYRHQYNVDGDIIISGCRPVYGNIILNDTAFAMEIFQTDNFSKKHLICINNVNRIELDPSRFKLKYYNHKKEIVTHIMSYDDYSAIEERMTNHSKSTTLVYDILRSNHTVLFMPQQKHNWIVIQGKVHLTDKNLDTTSNRTTKELDDINISCGTRDINIDFNFELLWVCIGIILFGVFISGCIMACVHLCII